MNEQYNYTDELEQAQEGTVMSPAETEHFLSTLNEKPSPQYKVIAINAEGIPLRVEKHYTHIDDAIGVAEWAYELLSDDYKVEVYHDAFFQPVARVSAQGIHNLVAAY